MFFTLFSVEGLSLRLFLLNRASGGVPVFFAERFSSMYVSSCLRLDICVPDF